MENLSPPQGPAGTWADYRRTAAAVLHDSALLLVRGVGQYVKNVATTRTRRWLAYIVVAAVIAGWNYSDPGAADLGTYASGILMAAGLFEVTIIIVRFISTRTWRAAKSTATRVRRRPGRQVHV